MPRDIVREGVEAEPAPEPRQERAPDVTDEDIESMRGVSTTPLELAKKHDATFEEVTAYTHALTVAVRALRGLSFRIVQREKGQWGLELDRQVSLGLDKQAVLHMLHKVNREVADLPEAFAEEVKGEAIVYAKYLMDEQ